MRRPNLSPSKNLPINRQYFFSFWEVAKASVTNRRQSTLTLPTIWRTSADFLHIADVSDPDIFRLFLRRQLLETCSWHLAWLPSMHCRCPASSRPMACISWCTHRLTVDLSQITRRLLHAVSLGSWRLIPTSAVSSVATIGRAPPRTRRRIGGLSTFDHRLFDNTNADYSRVKGNSHRRGVAFMWPLDKQIPTNRYRRRSAYIYYQYNTIHFIFTDTDIQNNMRWVTM